MYVSFLLHRLFENVCFLIGSAYFVAGSYPEVPEPGGGYDVEGGADKDDGSTASYYMSRDNSVSSPAHAAGGEGVTSPTGGGSKGSSGTKVGAVAKPYKASTGSDESLLSTPFISNDFY